MELGKVNIPIKKLVGKKDGDYCVCDYVFKNSKDFQGAVGSHFRPVGKDEYETMHDAESEEVKDRFRDIWAEAVKDGRTEESLVEFCDTILQCDGDDALWDLSYSDCWDLIRERVPELTEEEYPIFECVGGGRCFSLDMAWDELYDKKTWALICDYERKP